MNSDLNIGLLIPSFPEQTHIAMWRVGNSIRELGVNLYFMSTIQSKNQNKCHDKLFCESKNTFYSWPPKVITLLEGLLKNGIGIMYCAKYIVSLKESNLFSKIKLLPLIAAAINIKEYSNKKKINHIFVHSCADSAHLANMWFLLGGPSFSLRLGGDLDAYGKNHISKMKNAAFIVPAAENNLTEISERLNINSEKLFWSWLGVDIRNFVPSTTKLCLEDYLKIVTVARLNKAKGHEYILRAIRIALDECLNIEYKIIGSGPHEKKIKKIIKELNLENNVDLLGSQDEEKVIEYLQKADVFVLGSNGIGEASPVAVMEAMACATPVISTIIGGTTNMITNNINGILVPQNDEDAIAEAIIKLAKDTHLRERLGIAARRRAEESFDVKQTARRILLAIDTYLKGKKNISKMVKNNEFKKVSD